MKNKNIIGALLVGALITLQVQVNSSRTTIQQVRTESLRKLEELEQSSAAKISALEQLSDTKIYGLFRTIGALAVDTFNAIGLLQEFDKKIAGEIDRLTVFPARLAGPPVVVDATHPGFTQFAQRYASIGAGDLKQLVVYSNAAFAVFEHNLAVLPLNGTTFAPEPLKK